MKTIKWHLTVVLFFSSTIKKKNFKLKKTYSVLYISIHLL